MEVAVIGLGESLTRGRLRDVANVHENQISSITDKSEEIKRRTHAEIRRILVSAENELLDQLAPEQRDAAKNALGDFFSYENSFNMKRAYDRILERERISKGNQ